MWLVYNNKGFIYKEENSGSGFWDTDFWTRNQSGMFMLILRGFAGAAMDRPIWEVTLVVLWWRCHICHHNPDLGHFHWSSPATCLSPEPPLASHASPLAATYHPAAGQWNPSRALWKWSCMAWNIWKGLLSLSLIRITCFFLLWNISVNRWFLLKS